MRALRAFKVLRVLRVLRVLKVQTVLRVFRVLTFLRVLRGLRVLRVIRVQRVLRAQNFKASLRAVWIFFKSCFFYNMSKDGKEDIILGMPHYVRIERAKPLSTALLWNQRMEPLDMFCKENH